ncbi:hemin uptake protein HemP [Acidovorax sp. LjRoot118]|uniref:hemin uptake protein HemP n=1 Tax=unclassified Acidovorax TaxID=2684926 RepID=UPI000710C074|nr:MULTISPECIES: hemin uptake protein HemP [unclassified Acidovorax]KRC19138.1 hemin transporter HemP [Acidovorax sp. Root217]KRC31135.1 hemin transporter HemP [Acidovorax sp. Root219]
MQATLTAATLMRPASADSLQPQQAAALRSAAAVDGAAAVDSNDLLQGQKAVAISHNGSVYRLQATKLGKLILTK